MNTSYKFKQPSQFHRHLCCFLSISYLYCCLFFRVNLIFNSSLFNYFHTVTFLQVDAWLLADQHIKVKGQNNKLYSLSEACQDVVAYEKLTDDVSFCKVIYLFCLFWSKWAGLNQKLSK